MSNDDECKSLGIQLKCLLHYVFCIGRDGTRLVSESAFIYSDIMVNIR